MIKDIVVNLSLGPRDPAGDYALSIAEMLDCHILGVAFIYEPVVPTSVMGALPVEFIEAQRAESEKAAKAAVASFEKAAKRSSLSAETRILSASISGAADRLGRMARRFDLAVVGQPERDKAMPEDVLVETALFESGRPVIVVPYIQKAGIKLNRVMACWDGSRSAARALADAMSLLEKAKQVDVVIIANDRGKNDEIPGADIGQHLARHGLKVDVKRLTSPDIDVASTVLSYAADSSADLIVMGGYGHSRLREFVLGGATRGMLSAMTVPTLMSH